MKHSGWPSCHVAPVTSDIRYGSQADIRQEPAPTLSEDIWPKPQRKLVSKFSNVCQPQTDH